MFIGRTQGGEIYGAWANRQWPGQEEVPDDHPDLVTWRRAVEANSIAMDRLAQLDRATVRCLRERALGRGDAPDAKGRTANQVLADLEAEAVAERQRLK